jgi:DNA polymerase-4
LDNDVMAETGVTRTVLHVDMDAFFASVELRTRPELRGQPVVVAGAGERGVVVAATYEARAFGVHSAMPVGQARRLCPQAVWIEPHRAVYAEVSHGVMELLRAVTPLVQQVSIDEAFLDVTGALRRLGPARQIGERIRAQVRQGFGITCSVGIGRSKSVAKIASTRAKPDGLLEVPPDQTLAFLRPLPINALWGVGAKTEAALARLGIVTVGDLADSPLPTLVRAIGQANAMHLRAMANGQDNAPVVPERDEKSLGAEVTFDTDLPRGPELRRALLQLVERSTQRLRAQGLMCRTVGLKVRTSDFTTVSRARTLDSPVDSAKAVLAVAESLLAAVNLHGLPVRLIGVRLENLVQGEGQAVQLTLDQAAGPREPAALRAAEAAADQVRLRFGPKAVRPGTLVDTLCLEDDRQERR